MEEELVKNFTKAKEISEQAFPFARSLVKEGEKIFEIADKIENKIIELGGKPAFPVCVSLNEMAAHYAPDINDPIVIKENDLVKLDIGVQVNGYICDRAFTVCVGKNSHPLIEAADKALEEALKIIKSGAKVYEISEAVENTIESLGFHPIHNLCGHGVEQYFLHASPSIPNGKNTIKTELKEGMLVAMEVFPTTGEGWTKESPPSLIYRYREDKPVRSYEARKILELAKTKYERLPFAKRWLTAVTTPLKIEIALKQLVEVGALYDYPTLKEVSDGLVAQSEETVIVK